MRTWKYRPGICWKVMWVLKREYECFPVDMRLYRRRPGQFHLQNTDGLSMSALVRNIGGAQASWTSIL